MSWLKFDTDTPEKPEVMALTVAMGWDDPDLTVGKLLKVWRWFDQHTVGGNAPGVTSALLDRLIGVTGFSAQMAKVGWLVIAEDGISLPNFDRHNGKTAKDRALTAKRVAEHKSNAKANDAGNAASVSNALPREEKSKSNTSPNGEGARKRAPACPDDVESQVWADWLQLRKAKKAPVTETTITEARREAGKAGMAFEAFLRVWCRRGSQGLEASWLKPEEKARGSPPSETAYQRSMRERVAQFAPGIAAKAPSTAEVIDVTPRLLDRSNLLEVDDDLRA